MFGSKKGVSLLYVLMALVCVGAMGSLVLSMAKKEAGDSSLRTSSELARFSATAGLTYAASYFINPVNSTNVKNILEHWDSWSETDKNSNRWIVRGEGGKEFKEIDDMKFRVKIVNIDASGLKQVTAIEEADKSFFVVMLESESIDKSGSRAKNRGFYKITGFQKTGTSSKTPTHALYLGGGNMWIWCPIEVHGGPTYVGNRNSDKNAAKAIKHNSSSTTDNKSIYDKEFILVQGKDDYEVELANEEFRGPAYFEGGKVIFSYINQTRDDNVFYSHFGGNALFTATDANATVKNNSNPQYNSPSKNIVMLSGGFSSAFNSSGGYGLKFDNSINNDNSQFVYVSNDYFENNTQNIKFYTGSPYIPSPLPNSMTPDYIAKTLGITNRNPPAHKIELNDDIKGKKLIHNNMMAYGSVTENFLTEKWNDHTNNYTDDKGREWLVLEENGPHPYKSDGSFFGKRAIIIHKSTSLSFDGSFLNVSNNGNILFYVDKDVSVSGTGLAANQITGTFRGMFYNASSNAAINLSPAGNGWTVNGAFYNAPQTPGATSNSVIQFGTGANSKLTVNYDEAALQEFVDLGVVVPTEGGGDPIITNVPDYQGKSTMLSRSF